MATISGLTTDETSGLTVGELVTGDGTSTDIHVAPARLQLGGPPSLAMTNLESDVEAAASGMI
ncbi:MAG TPA: hypothetical protein VHU23_10170 [Rhizomicrobium sp.]|nr:hypothetical protein [Rhizomicrobium sp.]